MHEARPQFDWKGSGLLSLKTFRNGRCLYEAGRGHFAVDESNYLLLNEGQEYSLHIDSSVPVESFCIFFPHGFVEDIHRSLQGSDLYLLEEPCKSSPLGAIEWIERTYPMGNQLGAFLDHFRHLVNQDAVDSWEKDELLHRLAVHMLGVHRDVKLEMDELGYVKRSTREEIYRRVYLGHEYMSAYFYQPITLAETAAIAHLSVNHFLRNYKKLFHTSPHRYLTELRLQAAKQILLGTDKSITDICYEVGFESLGSFSSLFTRRFHVSPSKLHSKR
ncbi:AraC family transcriptional regulator [Paenibacillus tundrae]|uniref:AraC family transcriptional regulator n=1 Tax=Paenibacillus tundrae TaxID=528187 RepID=UPI0027D914B0|nr:AraC family transcriptional regulator [Paenibacillus tundrae]